MDGTIAGEITLETQALSNLGTGDSLGLAKLQSVLRLMWPNTEIHLAQADEGLPYLEFSDVKDGGSLLIVQRDTDGLWGVLSETMRLGDIIAVTAGEAALSVASYLANELTTLAIQAQQIVGSIV